MSQVQIQTHRGNVTLRCPWNADLAVNAPQLGGRWNAFTQEWEFATEHADHVVALALKLFSTDGTAPLVTARIKLAGFQDFTDVKIGGVTLIRRTSKVRRPELGPGVAVIRGGFSFEGTGHPTKPTLGINDAIIEFLTPATVALAAGLQIVPTKGHHDALTAEAVRLQNRLATVMQELAA